MHHFFPNRVYPVADCAAARQADEVTDRARLAAAWKNAGLRAAQLRCKTTHANEYYSALAIWRATFPPDWLWLANDHAPDPEIGFDPHKHGYLNGLHLGQKDGDPRRARRLLDRQAPGEMPRPLLGLSCHDENEVEAANSLNGVLDYIAFGPMFDTFSKTDTHPRQSYDGAYTVFCQSRLPVVLIGGLKFGHIAEITDYFRQKNAEIGLISPSDFLHDIHQRLYFAMIGQLRQLDQFAQMPACAQ